MMESVVLIQHIIVQDQDGQNNNMMKYLHCQVFKP